MADLQSRLIMSLIDRVTAPSRAVASAFGQVGAAAARLQKVTGITAFTNGVNAALDRSRSRLAAYRSGILEVTATAYTLAHAIKAPVKAAMEFESSMADVRKVVDFATPQAFVDFQKRVLEMSTQIPMAAKSLSQIVAAAGQAGIANGDLLKFTELAAKVGVAFDISADKTGESLSKMMTALSLSVDQVGLLADAMNHLSNSQASSAGDILEFFRRAGADGKMYGFQAQQTAAFGSAMLSAGAEADVAATSFRNMGRALVRGGAATKSQREAFARLGLSSKKIAKAMQVDAVGTTVGVLERINKLPKEMRAATASMLFGDEARALMPLIANLDLLKKSLGLVAKESDYAGSAQREYAVRAKTFANALQLFLNRIERMKIAIGGALIPILSDLMDRIAPFVDKIAAWVDANKELTGGLMIAVGGLVAFRVAAFAAGYAATSLRIAALLAALGVARLGQAATIAAAVGLVPLRNAAIGLLWVMQILKLRFVMGFAAMAAGGGVAAFAAGTFATLARAVWSVLVIFGRLARSFLIFSVAGLAVTAVVAAIVGAFVWLWNNLRGIGTFLAAFGSAFMAALGPAKGLIEPVVTAAGNLYDKVASWLGPLDESGKKWAEWGRSAGEAVAGWINTGAEGVSKFIEDIQKWPDELSKGFIKFGMDFGATINNIEQAIAAIPGKVAAISSQMYEAGVGLVTALWDGLKAQIDAMIGWFSGKISELSAKASALAHSMSFGMVGAAAPAVPAAVTAPAVAGARASGGPVAARLTYLVGERGPELFTPALAGYVSPNAIFEPRDPEVGDGGPERFNPASIGSVAPRDIFRRPDARDGGGGRTTTIGAIPITIHLGMMAADRSIESIGEELGRRIRASLDGVFADGTV